jgi:hypothetical protein
VDRIWIVQHGTKKGVTFVMILSTYCGIAKNNEFDDFCSKKK